MRLIILLLVIAMSAGAGLLVLNFSKPKEPEKIIVEVPKIQVEEVPKVDVLVARDRIPIGTKVAPDFIDRQPWPTHLKLDDFIVTDGKGDSDIMGLVTRGEFQKGEPIIRSKLANPSDPSFLAAALDKGMRAVTVAVDTVSSVAGFIYPGDRVDVLITHEVSMGPIDPNDPESKDMTDQITEVLVADLKVIAVDQKAASYDGAEPAVPGSVTLAASREDAQRILLAQDRGKLSMSLRSLYSEEKEAVAAPTSEDDLSRINPPSYFPVLYTREGPVNEKGERIDVSGAGEANVPFVLGPDGKPINPDGTPLTPEQTAAAEAAQRALLAGDTSMGGIGFNKGAPQVAPVTFQITVVRGAEPETISVDKP